jgi:acetyl-CoA C-acetyltransferase
MAATAVIVGMRRTAVGSFRGSLKDVAAPALGAAAARAAVLAAGLQPKDVQECFMGQVLQAGVGQAPARQAALGAGCALDTPSTTVNKVCASGMKAVMLAAAAVRCGDRSVVLAGGMESMSNAPHYLRALRGGQGYGDAALVDAIQHDGLTDAYDHVLMGKCSERVVKAAGLSRAEQDAFAIRSYELARAAQKQGLFSDEICAVEIKGPKGNVTATVLEDEECKKFMPEKFAQLKPAFEKDGTITAANASKINDGAAAMIVMSDKEAKARGLKPLARIVAYDDGAVEPWRFALANSLATRKLLAKTKLAIKDIDLHEINEAFAAVPLLNAKELGIDLDRINVCGGGVALGHPIGASGARIIMSLVNSLRRQDKTWGLASICNGGG